MNWIGGGLLKRIFTLVLSIILAGSGCAAQEMPVKRSSTGFYFDTVVTISAYLESDAPLKEALAACEGYERLLSKTIEGSDVWNINHAQGQPVRVSEHTLAILDMSRAVSEACGGTFDITVARAVALWDFTGGSKAVPDAESVARAAELIDYRKVVVEDDLVTVPAGMEIDLGAVAKGYICDQISYLLKDMGVNDALLNFGGNVIAMGLKPDGSAWTVGIQDPAQPTGAYLLAVRAESHQAVVTSGIYERGFDLDGVRYHHLLDPKTGWPAQNELASVTIFAEQSSMADALSTATFVLGLARGMEFIQNTPDAEALFITRTGEILATEGARELLIQDHAR